MKKQQPVTIKDIAAEVGMSISSVSRAMSDHPHISDKTKKKVKLAAEKLGYRYNALAAALRSSRSRTIGLIVPRISMPFQAAVITAIQNRLQAFGYNLMICQSNESPLIEEKLVKFLMTAQMEGIIVSCTLYTSEYSVFDEASSEIPVVFYDRVPKSKDCHKVVGDEFNGGYQVTRHLIEQGCKRIAHISGPLSCSIYQERYSGYVAALNDAGIPVSNELIRFHELNRDNALQSCKEIFEGNLAPDGIFACNDTSALAVLSYAKEHRIAVPQELKIVGYANDNRTEISSPQISSVEQFPHLMGEGVAELMMELVSRRTGSTKFISKAIAVELVKRGSSTVQ